MKLRNFLTLAVLIASSMLAFGQAASTGTILGHVEDSGGASIAGAKVTILNTATGIDHVVITNQDGEYTAPGLQPGSYKVTIEASGFGSKVSSVGLVVAQQERVDAALKLGGAIETVTVEASGGAQLDTDSAAISQLVSEKQVNQLPLNGRNFLNLLFIGAGAVQTVGEQGQMRGGEGNAISISGARPESNNYTLDGIVNTDTALSTPAVILSQDAIQEFKVQSETYSAEFGFSANQVNIVSKSGTNQFHGSLFEFNRNDAFDASTHFQALKPVLRQNQFGFVLSGPVLIPKIFNGHDKTFFLANYEGARIKAGTSPTNQFVPDPAQLTGNFAGSGLPAYGSDACTAALKAGNACQPIDPTTGLPFLNDSIPATRFSNIAKVTLGANLFPAPNEPGVTNGYVLRTVLANSTDQQTYRLDQNLKKYGSVFGRYTRAQYLNNSAGTVSVPFGLNVFTENSVSWQINHTISLGQNNVNNFRYGNLSAKSIQGVSPAPASAVDALGLTGIFTNLPDYARGYPNVSIGGGPASVGSPGNDPTTSDIPQYEIADSFTSIHGRHTLSIGFDYRSWIQKRDLSSNFLGSYSFASGTILTNGGTSDGTTQNATNPCTTAYCGTGNATADFLLGYYSGASTFQPGPFSTGSTPGNLNQFHFKYFAPYVQDDWKVTSNLTLNLGLRYDFRTIPTETDNKLFWIDKANAQGGLCFANPKLLTDGVAPAGNGFYRYCGRNNPRDAAKLPFAPRIGFAYRPFGDNKTVVRGGYGLYFDSTETREIDDSGDLYPYVVRTNINPVTAPGVPKSTDNLFPATAALHPVSVATDGGQFVAVIISENPINPYVQQYTLSVQHELAPNTTLEVNYIGNKGTHLLDRVNINEPLPVPNVALCNSSQGNDPSCNPAVRRPLPNFTNTTGTLDSRWSGYSNYNAGNIKFERRSSDLAAVLVYTYSKSMDDKSAAAGIGATNGFAGHLDDRNPSRDYARSDFDVGQRFVASFVYNLPFGQGKRYANKINRAADAAIGGWELTSIATFQKGFPFSVLGNDTYGLLSAYNQRANINGPANSGFTKSLNKWFNTGSFSQPLAGVFGSSGRNILRDPGINNFDIGLLKNFAVHDRINFQLRAETFNTFNHAQYGVDPSSPTAAASGPGTGAVDRNVNDVGSATNANFGQVVSARPGRVLQLGAKLTF
ncbi:hypothetical protein HDF16_003985 [Granulicella aggregans]|uniref:TonB-dependent transporter Oar-like beta-barrel domain-containing protein n=1 Tax=Granulicella aggregans TaxID=474949 RepID=A0A7W7ZG72_9BACT|nr:TonB-dependent receptor [Granulicella aggregans]MBB5059262.1 hypothetical protein [Granulicella aggregans]